MLFSSKGKTPSTTAAGSTTIIGSGVKLTGDIDSTSDIRIDGTVKGSISCSARVLIGAEGIVEGNVNCRQADVMGKVKGHLKAKELISLRGSAFIAGDLYAGQLQVEPTVNFNGHCYMNSNVVEMMKETNEQSKKAAAAK